MTATPTQAPTAVYTTIEVIATTVVPCTGSAGESSSSTVIISTHLSVPEVGFTTISQGPGGSTGVAVVPAPTTKPAAYPTVAPPTSVAVPTAPFPTSAFTTVTQPGAVTGTGVGVTYPTTAAPEPPIATAGAARMGAGVGLLGVVAMAVIAL